jgi:hypothetical protein
MVKYIATLILIGLASMMLCGFLDIGSDTHNMNHAGSDTLEHHFSMWSDISTALVSNIATSIAALISILVLAYLIVRNFRLSLLSTQLAYDRIPIEPDKTLGKRSKLTRWLALFENSPSYI